MGCVPSNPSVNVAAHDEKPMLVKSRTVELPNNSQPKSPYSHIESEAPLSPKPQIQQPGPPENIEVTSDSIEHPPVVTEPLVSEVHSVPIPDPITVPVSSQPEIHQTRVSVTSRPSLRNNELLLDFDTFLLFPDVQAVLEDKSAEVSVLLELFKIVDKDEDGYVDDAQREDLLELISLSYGKKSPKHNSVSSELAASTTGTGNSEYSSTVDVGLSLDSPSKKKEFSSILERQIIRNLPPAPVSTTTTSIEPITATSTSGPRGRAKPKIIRFIAPQLLDNTNSTLPHTDTTNKTNETTNIPIQTITTFSTKSRPLSTTSTNSGENKDSPAQKKGFMIAKRESFDKSEVISTPQSRFFVLDNGCLSYMDSTSKKPPFSMSHKRIQLTGVDIKVLNNSIELIPLRENNNNNNTSEKSEKDDGNEIVVLELKSKEECEEWMRAIQEHLEYSYDVE